MKMKKMCTLMLKNKIKNQEARLAGIVGSLLTFEVSEIKIKVYKFNGIYIYIYNN